MKIQYEYETGKFTRDFKIVREYDRYCNLAKCRLSGLPCYVDSDRCRKCKHYGGIISPLEVGISDFYIRCDHPEQKDSENIGEVIRKYYDYVKRKAMKAFYD